MSRKMMKKLIRKIPTFQCKEGCNDCCGPHPWSKYEWEQLPANMRKASNGILCPYISKKGCEVYEYRPVICRLYGTVKGMLCPYGCGPDKILTESQEKEIMATYLRYFLKNKSEAWEDISHE